jgi:integrase
MGSRIRIRADYGTAEFDAEYEAALGGSVRTTKNAPSLGTLAWLFNRYRESAAWEALSPVTRQQREAIFGHVLDTAGDQPFTKITASVIAKGVEKRAKTPSAARHFLDIMRGLFGWAVKNNHIKIDPTRGIENPARMTGDGYPPWTEEMVEAYQRHWSIGTRQRVWLDVLLHTGLRVGDAFRFGKQHVGQMKTEKMSREIYPEIDPVLATTLAAGPIGDLTYIISGNGRPFTSKGAFGNAFVLAAKAAGLKPKGAPRGTGSAHGVRKLSSTRAANAGATEAELEAIYGWSGGEMASLYTRTANRRRLTKSGRSKLGTSR